jgi:hypothetical protein
VATRLPPAASKLILKTSVIRYSPDQIAFDFFWGKIAMGRVATSLRRSQRRDLDGRWLAVARMVEVDAAIAHRGPRDVVGWSMVGRFLRAQAMTKALRDCWHYNKTGYRGFTQRRRAFAAAANIVNFFKMTQSDICAKCEYGHCFLL